LKVGFWGKIPNHQIIAVNQKAPNCLGLYEYFYDAVAKLESQPADLVETPIYRYRCMEHGDFESYTEDETQPCDYDIDDGILEGTCGRKSPYQSMRVEGAVFWGNPINLNTIASQMGVNYNTTCDRAAKLVELEFIGRRREKNDDEYEYWVTDCFKYNNRLDAMRPPENEVPKLIARERRRLKDRQPEVCSDCKETVAFDDIQKHLCPQKVNRKRGEFRATCSPNVLTFYDWVRERNGVAEPKKGDNDLMKYLEDNYGGMKQVMCVLRHVTSKGYWADSLKPGVNTLEFAVKYWAQLQETYTKEQRKEAIANKQKASVKQSNSVVASCTNRKAMIAQAELDANVDEEAKDNIRSLDDGELAVPPPDYDPYCGMTAENFDLEEV
jgi:hypothetical protein